MRAEERRFHFKIKLFAEKPARRRETRHPRGRSEPVSARVAKKNLCILLFGACRLGDDLLRDLGTAVIGRERGKWVVGKWVVVEVSYLYRTSKTTSFKHLCLKA